MTALGNRRGKLFGNPRVSLCPANNGMQLTGLTGAPNQLVSVHDRAVGRGGFGSSALQLMPGR